MPKSGYIEWGGGRIHYTNDALDTNPTTSSGGEATAANQVLEIAALTGAQPAGENHIGELGGNTKLFAATAYALDTNQYAAGDVLTSTLALANAFRINDGTGVLESFTLVDQDDQGVDMIVYFMDANVSLGTVNSAPNISDANALNILGLVMVAAADWQDLGGVRICTKTNIGLALKAGSGVRTLWTSIINGVGTPTFTASGLLIRPGQLND